jgi:hypothetical protein
LQLLHPITSLHTPFYCFCWHFTFML